MLICIMIYALDNYDQFFSSATTVYYVSCYISTRVYYMYNYNYTIQHVN